jgi:uncharacterized 2Fe-2S/4Fe-4S cluster protein (DUF4445 family)
MTEHTVTFEGFPQPVRVSTNTLLVEAAHRAGVEVLQPCGGQGRCGRCILQVLDGQVRRRSTLRLTTDDVASGYALACQTVVEGDLRVAIPPQDKIERRLTTDRTVAEVAVPPDYNFLVTQTIRRVHLDIHPPSIDDQTDDWSRLQTALRLQAGYPNVKASLAFLRELGEQLRESDWKVTVILNVIQEYGPQAEVRLVRLFPGHVPDETPVWGAAVDIGTTTVTLWLVDLVTGQVRAQVSEYNGQIACGEDVISRIIYSSREGGAGELRSRVLQTIGELAEVACKRVNARVDEIVKATIAGNSTMIHLLLGIPASSIRLSPFIPAVNNVPLQTAREIGLVFHPEATVDCLPGVASYVGADITSGVLSTGMDEADQITLFIDVGTNGEIVLGSRDWMVACACSAGPAFEGAGVLHGMRATHGAIEEVWIAGADAPKPYEPTYRVIGGGKARGLCGSGLISLLAEMFLTGLIDKSGGIVESLPSRRVRQGEHGPEYVVAWGDETETGQDIAITHVDIDNLLRAKAAIYAGFTVLADSVGVPLEAVDQLLIGGSFGKYINVEKAVQIGLLPDMPWERIHFLGNTSVRGAYYVLLNRAEREHVQDIASRMTYIELSADNTFYEAFMSALFLPHTDLGRFPSVASAMEQSIRIEEEG